SPGEWAWSSLITADPDAAAAFYQGLFGYEVFDMSSGGAARHLLLASGGFSRASVNSRPTSRPDERGHWLNFVRVQSAAATVAKAEALGGRILVQPRLGRSGDTIALVADPQGAVFGLLEAASDARQGASQ
ncbi:MAG: VOC family protein, partial [Acetobacteraceae bacterium]